MKLVNRVSPGGFRHPTRYGLDRHPTNDRRLLLHFDDDPQIELDVHQCLVLIEMLSQFLRGCVVSEYEMERGRAEVERERHVERAIEGS